jgi:opacity protein-like surface antigen
VRGEYRYTNLSDFDNDDDAGEVQDLTSHTVRVGVGVLF